MIALMILSAAMVYLVIGNFIVRRIPSKWEKRIAIAILILIPIGDSIVGHIYFNYLCSAEAGVKVYQVAELPAEYWDGEGRPKFFNKYGNLERDFWVSKLDEPAGDVKRYSTFFAVDKDTSLVKEKSSQKVLAEIITFRYWGGWLARNFDLIHNTANSCGFIRDPDFSRNFYGSIFKPATSTR